MTDAEGAATAPLSRTDWVIDRIRRAILFGEVRPGERLISTAWSTRLGVSQTPLREAFQYLAAEGFVDYDPQHGARVAALTLRDAVEIYELRITLEPQAVESSVNARTESWCEGLAAAFETIDTLYAGKDTMKAGSVEAHRHFHRVLRAGCGSAWLLRMTATLADQSTRMQFASLYTRGGNRAAREEHRELYEAASMGNAALTASLTAAHLQRTLAALLLQKGDVAASA